MSTNNADEAALEAVRELEKVRIVAIRDNNAEAMAEILDEKFIYINDSGKIYDRDSYTTAVRSHGLTYSSDLQLTETDHRVDGD
ncbi:MAG: nuclear transport factor 2 family protein, partial [Sphingomicrobium sp.]